MRSLGGFGSLMRIFIFGNFGARKENLPIARLERQRAQGQLMES